MNLFQNQEKFTDEVQNRYYSSVRLHIYDKKDLISFKKLIKKIRGQGIHIFRASEIMMQRESKKKKSNPLFDPSELDWWRKYWKNMPAFESEWSHAYLSTDIFFDTQQDMEDFSELVGQTITEKSQYIHWPKRRNIKRLSTNWVAEEVYEPQYPVYIISKGRWESRLTSKCFEKCGVPYRIVVEPQEYDQYSKVIDPKKILVTPFSNLGQGSIPVRNFVWEHSMKEGHKRHWIIDDNIRYLFRFHQNNRYRVLAPNPLYIIEQFVDRYKNIGLSGMHYKMFMPDNEKRPPFYLNTRIYSFILIDNALPFRWRGRFNEDTDLSLRVLKDGHCTVLFNTLLCDKIATMRMKGGNTEELYGKTDNRREFAESLKEQHPDRVKITKKWGRWHHHVNYDNFNQRPVLKKGVKVPNKVNEFGLTLKIDTE